MGAGRARTVSAMTNATATESQTTLKGTSCLFTRYQTCENGIARSLEKAYPILRAHFSSDWVSERKANWR